MNINSSNLRSVKWECSGVITFPAIQDEEGTLKTSLATETRMGNFDCFHSKPQQDLYPLEHKILHDVLTLCTLNY